jgi:hypothetical protein
LNRGEKISGEFVVARRNGSKVLNFIEETLDEIALAVSAKSQLRLVFRLDLGHDWAIYGRRIAPGRCCAPT